MTWKKAEPRAGILGHASRDMVHVAPMPRWWIADYVAGIRTIDCPVGQRGTLCRKNPDEMTASLSWQGKTEPGEVLS